MLKGGSKLLGMASLPSATHQHLACLQPPAAHRNRRGRRAHTRPSPPAFGLFAISRRPPEPQGPTCPHPSKPTSIWLVCNLPPPTGTAGADVPTPVQAHPPGLTTPTGATGTDVHTTLPGPPPRLDPAHRSDRGRRARRAHYLSQPTPWLDRQLSPSYLPPLS